MPEELLFGTGIASIRGKSHRVADMNDRNDKVCVFGASPGTGNQGVSALLGSQPIERGSEKEGLSLLKGHAYQDIYSSAIGR